jgi:hypothetical protein
MSNVISFADRKTQCEETSRAAIEKSTREIVNTVWPTLVAAGLDKSLTVTARNLRFREQRQAIWQKAETLTRYWRLKLDFDRAEHAAGLSGLSDEDWRRVDWDNVQRWRRAIAAQLVTPAARSAAVTWKRRMLDRPHDLTFTKPELVRQSIEQDEAWLAAHPFRQKRDQESAAG